MSQHGYMRHTATPPLVLEIGQKLWQYCPILSTDDLAHFRRPRLGCGQISGRFSGVRGPNFTKLAEEIGRSSLLTRFVSEFRYLAAFSMQAVEVRMMLKMRPNFALFAPPP